MVNHRILVAVMVVSLQPLLAASGAQTFTVGSPNLGRQSNLGDTLTVPKWLPVAVRPALYQKWRKYGQWDYKQRAFIYRDGTQLNFGATGSAAGYDQASLLVLAQASKPTPGDIKRLDEPDLRAAFNRERELLDSLRRMAEQDVHVIRVAPDFTWLDSTTKWPRENVGFGQARWNTYRSLFKTLSLPEGIVRTDDFPGAIFFVARVRGLCTGGSSAGYVYSTKPLTPTVESPKDALAAEVSATPSRNYAYVFKTISPDWYAFYEVDW